MGRSQQFVATKTSHTMETEKQGRILAWFMQPTKRVIVIVITLTIIANLLLVMAITDFFAESFFDKKTLLVFPLMLGSIGTAITTYHRYQNKKERGD